MAFTGTSAWRQRAQLLWFWRLPRWWTRPGDRRRARPRLPVSIGTFGLAAVAPIAITSSISPTSAPRGPRSIRPGGAYIGPGFLPNGYGIGGTTRSPPTSCSETSPAPVTSRRPMTQRSGTASSRLRKTIPASGSGNFWTKRVIVADALTLLACVHPFADRAFIGERRRSIRAALLVACRPACWVHSLRCSRFLPVVRARVARQPGARLPARTGLALGERTSDLGRPATRARAAAGGAGSERARGAARATRPDAGRLGRWSGTRPHARARSHRAPCQRAGHDTTGHLSIASRLPVVARPAGGG